MFENEELLVAEIKQLLEQQKVIFRSNMKVLSEVNVGYGIADLVVALYCDVSCRRKRFLNSTQVQMFCTIEGSPGTTISGIVDATGSSEKLVRESLKILEEERLVVIKKGHVFADEDYTKALTGSIAIEAKLKDWKRALKQAYRYKWFSERSYVCLPTANISAAIRNIDLFHQLEVGLVGISDTNSYEIHYNPKPAPPLCREMNILLNERLLSELCSFSEKMTTSLSDSRYSHRLNKP